MGRVWESVEADIVTINNRHYLCSVSLHMKFPVIKWVEAFSRGNLVKA